MDRTELIIFKLEHKRQFWIGIKNFALENSWKKVKTMPISKYSKTHRCWYIPYTKESYYLFQMLKIPYNCQNTIGTIGKLSPNDVPTAIGESTPNSAVPVVRKFKKDADIIEKSNNAQTNIRWTNKTIYLQIPYVKKDVEFLKSLQKSFWDSKLKKWVIASTLANVKKIQSHFEAWNNFEYDKILKLSINKDPNVVCFFTSLEYQNKLLVKITGFGASVSRIKEVPNREYDKHYKKWIIPWSTKTYQQLKIYYEEIGYKIIDRVPKDKTSYEKELRTHHARLQYLHNKFPISYREKIIKYSELLLRQRYSWKSINSYTGKLAKYIEFYNGQDIDTLTEEDANYYLSQLAKKEVSNSLLNVTLSAIKLYYLKIAYHPSFNIERLERPRKRKNLPSILSVREVDNIFRSIKNLKHLCVLYTIYGGGLRLSEVINLKVQDVLWDRNQIQIKSGKGNKDRMVMLSQALKELLKQYFNEYKPQYWLFEGADKKTQYSSSSIQKMVRTAVKKVGISRKVTPHTLRHCFATHLMDNGTDTRYIQELLGHKDIRTTLIYTHVTTSNIKTIQSPLDQMNGGGYKVKKRNG